MNKKNLTEFEIKEFIRYFGVKVFTNKDLEFWKNKKDNYIDFMNKYFLNLDGDVEYANNILRIYYDITDDLTKRLGQIELKSNDNNYGNSFIETVKIPLFDYQNNLVGVLLANEVLYFIKNDPILNITQDEGLILQSNLTYFLEKNIFFPSFLDEQDTLEDEKYQTINITQSTGSRSNLTPLYLPGDVYVLKGSSESQLGLDKMDGVVCIYVDENNRRNLILNFDKVTEINFIPKENYGRGDV